MGTELAKWIPKSFPAAISKLKELEIDVDSASTYDEIRKLERSAAAIREYWKHVTEVREQAERVIVLAGVRAGAEEIKVANEKGWQPKADNVRSAHIKAEDRHGSRFVARRLKQLAKVGREQVLRIIDALHADDKDATRTAVVKFWAAEQSALRRAKSRAALPLNNLDFRDGDCRKVLKDIKDDSVDLVLTDPPYGDEAEPLYRWLAEWSARVLTPGGSLICYTGQSRLNRDMKIFDEHLRYWWLLTMPHKQPQRLPGKFVVVMYKPVLWYVKDVRASRTMMPDVLRHSKREKELHDWGQGEAGVTQIIETLTDPDDLILDPFAGTGLWGQISDTMGRRWIGCDIVRGGDSAVVAHAEAAE